MPPEQPPSRDDSLLAQIERDVLDKNVPLSDVLLKCVALSGHARSTALRDWAKNELNGYTEPKDVPSYRTVAATLWLQNTNRVGYNPLSQRVSQGFFPEQLREYFPEQMTFTDPVAELEAMASREGPLKLTRPYAKDAADMLTRAGWQSGGLDQSTVVAEIYWQVETAAIAGVLSRIRAALTVFVAELREHMPPGQHTPSAAATEQALHAALPGTVTVTASTGATVNIQQGDNASSTVSAAAAEPAGARGWRLAGWILGFLVAAVGTYAGLGEWLGWPAPWK